MRYMILGIVVMLIVGFGGASLIVYLGNVTDTTDQTIIGALCGVFGGLVGSMVWGMRDE